MERKKDMGMEAVVNFENSTMCREIDKTNYRWGDYILSEIYVDSLGSVSTIRPDIKRVFLKD